jgi:hypothetical protein
MQNTSSVHTEVFNKGLYKDINDIYISEGQWTHARNVVNNSSSGDVGVIGNEQANVLCTQAPYQIIGTVYIGDGTWAIYSTNNHTIEDNLPSEIGLFDENTCSYYTIVNDTLSACKLNFSKVSPIIGVSKSNADCTTQLYWDDGFNPSRTLNIGDGDNWPNLDVYGKWPGVPYKQIPAPADIDNNNPDCDITIPTNDIDCDALRLAALTSIPCITVEKGIGLGSLPNGSYQATIAYTVNSIKVTDYVTISNVQPLWSHENVNGSLDIFFDNLDSDYDEFELVVISFINQQTVAKSIGVYSTNVKKVSLDLIDNALPSVPIEQIPLRTPAYEKSDAMYKVNNYLVRVGPTTSLDFNYQPKANKIKAKWVAVKYPADYYYKGGNKTSFMRDEVYSFFIRWVYNTGDKSASYHIPGRSSKTSDIFLVNGPDAGNDVSLERWKVESTASITSYASSSLQDGGVVVLSGDMGYWESTERYPDNKPDQWAELCGKQIRHHKFPEDAIYADNRAALATVRNYDPADNTIVVLGVEFENIEFPVDNQGNPITNIVGYEILRGSREGHRSILAKGIINNMREYDIPNDISNKTGLYVNYPYNYTGYDPFLGRDKQLVNDNKVYTQTRGGAYRDNDLFDGNTANDDVILFDGVKDDIFSFHSPETTFRNPFLSASELKVYGTLTGAVTGRFKEVDNHPKHKLITDTLFILSSVAGVAIGNTAANTADGGPLAQLELFAKYVALSTPLSASTGGFDLGLASIIGGLALTAVYKSMLFTYFYIQATDNIMEGVKSFSKYQQYALQYVSHGFYSNFEYAATGQRRRSVDKSSYLQSANQDYTENFTINNNLRAKTVVLTTNSTLNRDNRDNTLFTVNNIANSENGRVRPANTSKSDVYATPWEFLQNSTTVTKYAALKVAIDNQYGQLEQIKQIPVGCIQLWNRGYNQKDRTDVIFGGDVYINRYTEKNTFFYFSKWLENLPNGTEYDYRLYNMLPYPRYWMDTNKFESTNFISGILGGFSASTLPNDFHHLDRQKLSGFLILKNAYMYLFNSGIRDFYVESEINLALRDYEEDRGKRHYDFYTYTDYESLFDPSYIRDINYYKYDYSLSLVKHYSSFISWGNLQARSYDPNVAEQCYTHYPERVIYSLPQESELLKDNWRQYLANNYYDFDSRVIAMKPIGGTGAIIMLENQSPILMKGVEEIDLNSGTKLTIGDGGLFNGQPLQNIINVDSEIEYGSCQSRLSVVNTPAGIFYLSRNQGKVFNFSQGLNDISRVGMKWWFNEFLPFSILEDFPEFDLLDNTIVGVGCQSVYDNDNEVIFFLKKDYKLKPQFKGKVIYDQNGKFLELVTGSTILLGNSKYFDNASWTVSYDVKGKSWISFHDWHPNLVLGSKLKFLTVLNNQIWKHNDVCNLYCNFYGVPYPFEIEYVQNQGQEVTTTRSVEYALECYTFDETCNNKYHQLTQNFDEAVIYNTEQISGILRLTLTPTSPYAILNYPQINTSNIDILYSKVEQKYRFNQFWDITNDRANPVPMWLVEPNGYIRNINTSYVNYNKGATERKKFRHYVNRVLLRKVFSGTSKFLFKVANNKLLKSFR